MHLESIPAGLTDEYQPLDRRIYGSLKARARQRFDLYMRKHGADSIDFEVAIEILLDAWKSITEDEVRHAWDHLVTYEDE